MCVSITIPIPLIFARWVSWGFFDILHRTDVVTEAALVNKIWRWSGLGYLGKIV